MARSPARRATATACTKCSTRSIAITGSPRESSARTSTTPGAILAGNRAVRRGGSHVLARDRYGDPGRRRRSATAWRRSPTTRCRRRSAQTCGRISTISRPTRSCARSPTTAGPPTVREQHLRPGAEFRLLHGEHASGLAEAGGESVDGDAGWRPRGGGVRPQRSDHDGARRHGGDGRGT